MAEIQCIKVVEPRGVEPLTSTLPVLALQANPPFFSQTDEEHMRTEPELQQLSVPVGPSSDSVVVGNFPAPRAHIYFVSYNGGPVKIGLTWDVRRRLRDIQTYCPYKLELMAVARGPVELEPEYHERFAASRLEGEWFERTPELMAEIERLNDAKA